MRIKIASLFCVAAFLMLIASTVGAWDTGNEYNLHGSGISQNIAVKNIPSWTGDSANQREYMRFPGVAVWDLDKYDQDNKHYQSYLKKLDLGVSKKTHISGARSEAWIDSINSSTAGISYASRQEPSPVPETSTMVGFGAALAINGIGVAGSGYYLRRRYNKASARNYANRHISTMSLYLDTAVSMLVLISVSPILVALAAAGALKTDKPAVFGARTK